MFYLSQQIRGGNEYASRNGFGVLLHRGFSDWAGDICSAPGTDWNDCGDRVRYMRNHVVL